MSTSGSSGIAFRLIPDDIKEIARPVRQSDSPTIAVSKLQNDIKMLETGTFADCTVISKDQTWPTHKVILGRCPYFARAFSSSNGFKVRNERSTEASLSIDVEGQLQTVCVLLKEAVESKIIIENFETFEVSWLLLYIYGLRINVEHSKETSPSKSFLETCALLWTIGDFFRLAELSQSVLTQLQWRCRILHLQTRCASTMLKKIDFLPDLEAGIRAAGAMTELLARLLDEIPEFTAQYVKALLGCPRMQRVNCHERRIIKCDYCRDEVFDFDRTPLSDEAFCLDSDILGFLGQLPSLVLFKDLL